MGEFTHTKMGMSEKSDPRAPLKRARFYAALASAANGDRDAFSCHLETAIIYARAVTHYLRAAYTKRAGFKDWFDTLWENKSHKFLVDKRSYILKQGPAGVHKKVAVSTMAEITVSSSLEIKVIRSQPWYRRRPSILWEDFRRAIKLAVKRPIDRWASIWRARKRRRQATKRSEPAVTVGFYFDDDQWRDRPALELLEGYFEWLETVIRDAEARFGGGSAEASHED